MKKVLFLTLALLLYVSTAASAEGIKVSGGYLFGSFDAPDFINGEDLKAKENGLVISGEAQVIGPFGVMVDFYSLKASNQKVAYMNVDDFSDMTSTRFDILGTYALPIESINLKVVAGYAITTTDFTSVSEYGTSKQSVKTKGFLVGAVGEFSPTRRLNVSGSVGFGLGTKWEADTEWYDGEWIYTNHGDGGLLTYKLAACYEALPNVAIEGGYIGDKYAEKGTFGENNQTINGLFLGVRESF